MAHQEPLYQFLSTNGDGTGTVIANVDGSGTPVPFKIIPPAGHQYLLNRMIIHVQDTNVLNSNQYGNIASLANGITIGVYRVADDSEVYAITNGQPIKQNAHWNRFCHDVSPDTFGAGNKFVSARFSFFKAGQSIPLSEDEYFAVTINDNLTGLVDHTFQVQGRDIHSNG